MPTAPQPSDESPLQLEPIPAAVVLGAQPAASRAGYAPAYSAPAAPQRVFVQHTTSGSLLWKMFSALGWIGFIGSMFMLIGLMYSWSDYYDTSEGITEKYHSRNDISFVVDKVAIIDISGVIMEGEGYVKSQIDRVLEDENVQAVVVRVDSPGGTVTGSDYIYHHLKEMREELKIPMVVSMGSMAASGGYYVAMAVGDQENVIFAEPTTTTGSIGVIIPHYDISGLMARYDVKDDSIASHPRKQMLSMTRPIPEEHREILQAYVNESFDRFKDIVKSGRPKFRQDDEALVKLATGEIFTAKQAIKLGLVDEIGFLEDAIDRAIELADLDPDQVRVIEYERPVELFDISSLMMSRQQRSFDLATLFDLASPKAYYLATSLPTLVTSKRAD